MLKNVPSWITNKIALGYAAVYFAGPTEVVYRRPGDNSGHRPIRTGVTTSYRDTVTPALDGASWQCPQRVFFRAWCRETKEVSGARALLDFIHMSLPADKLRKSYVSFPFDLDMGELERAVHLLADDCNLECWSDEDIVEHVRNSESIRAKRLKEGASQ